MEKFWQSKSIEFWIPYFLFGIAFILRFYHYSNTSLSNDELSALSRIYPDSIFKTIEFGVKPDGHPAGIQIFLHYLTALFGNSAAVIRLPFVLFGSGSVLLIYFIAKSWFGAHSAIVSATALSLLEFPILYSQLARPYSSGLFLALLSVYIFNRFIFERNSIKQNYVLSVFFGFLLALNLYNHYFSGLFAFILANLGFFFVKKENIKAYLLSLLIAVLLFLPHLNITLNIFRTVGGLGNWLAKPDEFWFFNHLIYIFNNQIWLCVLVISFAISTAIYFKQDFKKRTFQIISFFLFFLPFAFGYSYSIWLNPILQHPALLFSMPFLLLLLFSFLPKKSNYNLIYLFVGVFVFGIGFYRANYYKTYHFDNFKGAAFQLNNWEKRYDFKNVLLLQNINNPWYLEYYTHKNNDFKISKIQNNNDLEKLKSILNTTNKSMCLYIKTSVANEIALDMMQAHFPKQIEKIIYGDFTHCYLFENTTSKTINPNKLDSIKSSDEFFNGTFWTAPTNGNYQLLVEFYFEGKQKQNESLYVIQTLNKEKKEISWQGIPLNLFEFSKSRNKFCCTRTFKLRRGESIRSFIWNIKKDSLIIQPTQNQILKINE